MRKFIDRIKTYYYNIVQVIDWKKIQKATFIFTKIMLNAII